MEDKSEYSLAMPFVVVKSDGGPFDDEAFVAGWECGVVYQRMAQQEPEIVSMCNPELFRQYMLMSQKWGYSMDAASSGDDENWREYTFTLEQRLEGEK